MCSSLSSLSLSFFFFFSHFVNPFRQQENGVATAIQAVYRDMEYAKTLIKHRASSNEKDNDQEGGAADEEESWTFIGDESDPELARRIAEWEPMARRNNSGRWGRPVMAVESDLNA